MKSYTNLETDKERRTRLMTLKLYSFSASPGNADNLNYLKHLTKDHYPIKGSPLPVFHLVSPPKTQFPSLSLSRFLCFSLCFAPSQIEKSWATKLPVIYSRNSLIRLLHGFKLNLASELFSHHGGRIQYILSSILLIQFNFILQVLKFKLSTSIKNCE